jgi:TPR repeat protein
MKLLTASILFLCVAALAQTNWGTITFTNSYGLVISNAEVRKVDAKTLLYIYSNGGGTVRLADLPRDLQARFGYMQTPTNAFADWVPTPKLTDNDQKKFEELKIKAATGDAEAEADLGHAYANGLGTLVDYNEAFEWNKKSAEQGNAKGENGLGWCYLHGFGVEIDPQQAYGWLQLGAKQGNERQG